MKVADAVTFNEAVQAFEDAILDLPGVTHARVVTASGPRIAEVHVVANYGRETRSIKRDIESLAKARFHLDLDHRVVSIAATDPRRIPRESDYRTALENVLDAAKRALPHIEPNEVAFELDCAIKIAEVFR